MNEKQSKHEGKRKDQKSEGSILLDYFGKAITGMSRILKDIPN